MPLRRYQPILRASQWSEIVEWIDPRTRQPNDLTEAVLTMALYQDEGWGCRDYGWSWWNCRGPWNGFGRPVLAAMTQADGSGPFVILPGALKARFTFAPSDLARLCPGAATLLIWATVNGATDEVTRTTLQVLEGPVAMPILPVAVPTPPPPDPSANVTVIVDGGEI